METAQARGETRVAGAARRSLYREAVAVFQKDVRSELRSRSAIYSILLFALTTLAVLSMTVITRGLGLDQDLNLQGGDTRARFLILSALLWIVLFFSAVSGMARAFVKEEEQKTVLALRLAGRPLAVYLGKLLFNSVLILAVAAVVTPLFLVLFEPPVRSPWLLATEVAAGCCAMAAAATILGAIVARAGGSVVLFAALGFPLLLFVLILAIQGTAGALEGGARALVARNQLPALVSYLVAMVAVSAMLFDHVWRA